MLCTPVLNIRCECAADICRQRQSRLESALAAHKKTSALPVDVVQTKGGNVPSAKAEACQQQNDRVIAKLLRRLAARCGRADHSLDGRSIEVSRQRSEAPVRHGRNCVIE
jgi:hypothetical protein